MKDEIFDFINNKYLLLKQYNIEKYILLYNNNKQYYKFHFNIIKDISILFKQYNIILIKNINFNLLKSEKKEGKFNNKFRLSSKKNLIFLRKKKQYTFLVINISKLLKKKKIKLIYEIEDLLNYLILLEVDWNFDKEIKYPFNIKKIKKYKKPLFYIKRKTSEISIKHKKLYKFMQQSKSILMPFHFIKQKYLYMVKKRYINKKRKNYKKTIRKKYIYSDVFLINCEWKLKKTISL
jgi:hypothetical protein